MSMRRFTRLTNAFSKKVENHAHAIAIHYMHYNFCRVHQTLRVTRLAFGWRQRSRPCRSTLRAAQPSQRNRRRVLDRLSIGRLWRTGGTNVNLDRSSMKRFLAILSALSLALCIAMSLLWSRKDFFYIRIWGDPRTGIGRIVLISNNAINLSSNWAERTMPAEDRLKAQMVPSINYHGCGLIFYRASLHPDTRDRERLAGSFGDRQRVNISIFWPIVFFGITGAGMMLLSLKMRTRERVATAVKGGWLRHPCHIRPINRFKFQTDPLPTGACLRGSRAEEG